MQCQDNSCKHEMHLTHWGRNKMDAILQTTLSNTFSLNENVRISIKISLKFIPKGPINNIPGLVQIMAWRRPGDKPLSELMMVRLPTHKCITRPQWVNKCQIRYSLVFSQEMGIRSYFGPLRWCVHLLKALSCHDMNFVVIGGNDIFLASPVENTGN